MEDIMKILAAMMDKLNRIEANIAHSRSDNHSLTCAIDIALDRLDRATDQLELPLDDK